MNWIPLSVVPVVSVQLGNNMHTIIGTKMILAKAMNRREYNEYRGWLMPANEDGSEEGYLVEYMDGPSNHDNHTGYISWSPKKQFDAAYLDLGLIDGRLPHQQRVIGEHAQLKAKCDALSNFFDTAHFLALHGSEQSLMRLQYQYMSQYLAILGKRIENFR